TYTFIIRDGITFHNGQSVTAQDAAWSIERCLPPADPDSAPADPEIFPVKALEVVDTVEAVDERTLVITLKEPSNEFLSYLTVAILPRDYTEQDTAPVGTGPFKYVSRQPQVEIVLEKNEEYWGTPAQLDKVVYKVIENSDTMLMSLQSGAIDLCSHLTGTQVSQLPEGFHVEEGTMNLVNALYLNHAVKPLDDIRVRQALCLGVDKQGIIDLAFDGYGKAIGSSVYPAFTKYFDDSLTHYYTRDVEKAKALLAEAGYPDGLTL
ncbi:dipeptide-binding protein, partial [gut metagenome]